MTMNTFNFNGQDLRTITRNDEPWFVAVDACRALGLPVGGPAGGATRYLVRLDADEKQILSRGDIFALPLFSGTFSPTLAIISESGLYKLTMRSSKPEAKVFQNWVTKEVLPSIRKTGGYLLNEEARTTAHADTKEAMPLPEGFAQMFQMLFAPIVKPLEDKISEQGAIILSMQAHLEKMASGEEPSDVWMSGDLTRDMTDAHIRNAIKWAKKSRVPYDVLTKEQARRIRLKKKVAA